MIVDATTPRVFQVLEALNDAEVEYCLLRGYDELADERPIQEIDLLVAPEAFSKFVETAERSGFTEWPAWGHAPHRFFLAYDAETGGWIKLDVVTRLHYGSPIRALQLDLVEACLERKRRRDPTYVLAPADELLTLLLHAILDKRRFRDANRARLAALWDEVTQDEAEHARLRGSIAAHLGQAFGARVEQAMPRGDWEMLLGAHDTLQRTLAGRASWATAWRRGRTLALRKLRRALFLLRRHGTSVVLLAPDGGGKTSLARDLVEDPWLRARLVYMGTNTDSVNVTLPTTQWLKTRSRSTAGPRWLRRALKAANTVNQLLEEWYRHGFGTWHKLTGRVVVFDRYIYDTFVSPRAQSFRVRARRWLVEKTCAAPDLVFLLDAPGEVLHRRKLEHTPEFLEAQRQTYRSLRDHVPNFVIIDATRDRESVRRDVVARIWERHARRQQEQRRETVGPVRPSKVTT